MNNLAIAVLCELSEKQIKRIKNTSKEFIFFSVSVFNVGAVVRIRCTNNYKPINKNTWNGYDFWLESKDAANCLELLGK